MRHGALQTSTTLLEQANRMAATLVHRGPDAQGAWSDEDIRIGLGHRRLSIIDLSREGHQPMQSANGRYVMIYNGEIYNFHDLRTELNLLGHSFRGHSDTEVILAGFVQWGIEATVTRLIGMFAIALWDRSERNLFLIRDRVGIKPIYWTYQDRRLLFASELKAFHAVDDWQPEICENALAYFFGYSCVPSPLSIYKNVYKLKPGHILQFSSDGQISQSCYWSLSEIAQQGWNESLQGSDLNSATDALEELIRDAIKRRMIADVPLGAFLSGGIDSTLVTALMQAQSDTPVKTFTIGFSEDQFNEATHAAQVAKILGTDHVSEFFSAADALELVPKLAELYDEPFADSSQLPTHLISLITRRHVSVALSGDGGDELFAGYNRYIWFNRVWGILSSIPKPLRSGASKLIPMLSTHHWDMLADGLPKRYRVRQAGDKLHLLASALQVTSREELYNRLIQKGGRPERFIRQPVDIPAFAMTGAPDTGKAFIPQMQYGDMHAYLPDDILTKVDRASMGAGLEARVPLLDHRVVEFAWSLPMDYKLRNGQGKWILREILYKYVPKEVMERPKAGFGIPLQSWLSGPLRDWAEALLAPETLARDDILNPTAVRAAWDGFISNGSESPYLIWNLLMYQAWKARWHP